MKQVAVPASAGEAPATALDASRLLDMSNLSQGTALLPRATECHTGPESSEQAERTGSPTEQGLLWALRA